MPKSSRTSSRPWRELGDQRLHGLALGHQHALGELELDLRGSAPCPPRARATCRARPGSCSWRGEMLTPRRSAARPAPLQACDLASARRMTHKPSSVIMPLSSAIGTNRAGITRPSVGVAPAQQGLEAPRSAAARSILRLVDEEELARARGRAAARFSSSSAGSCASPHRRVEQANAVPAGALAAVHGGVGVLQQHLGRRGRAPGKAMPDAGA